MILPPAVGLSRIAAAKQREINRLDLEQQSFHEKVREGYLQLLEKHPSRIVKIDADQDPGAVLAAAIDALSRLQAGISPEQV